MSDLTISVLRNENDRLRSLNTELVAALEHLIDRHNSGGANGAALEWAQARAAIAKAKASQK